ncbi:nucleoside triphosphate pyrophosphohydrolase [Synechococcus bigranulatus str. 'Rupite']|uniref:Nucleoside triphosphate pyrophosphohydrolase n=2 Tax=Thermostichus vulcanus TaxID=32053 RepID=A0ABT0CDF9_THEVL|nr:nucleoside triphosphate pyrophosphohydrolase [Thermostichus vulcanus]MCJ2543764.1 nucleoside triphosphate pyrophosphohydrolase [Thermostichus vulcanus str. 'Rupite']
MLQTLDSLQPGWPKHLAQWCITGRGSLLLKRCGEGDPAELREVLQTVCASGQSLTLLAEDLEVVAGPLTLQSWDPQSTGHFTHLYLERSASAQHMSRLAAIVAQLRAPTGCPWDQAQTPESLTPYILEEAYETVAAIRAGDPAAIADELGDLLLQVVLQSQISAEQGQFDLETVAAAIADKLIRRHPHVFGEAAIADLPELHRTWEDIKQTEQPDQTLGQKLLHYAQSLPPLMAALKISRKVVGAGFEWPDVEGIWAKIREEEAELRQELERATPDPARQSAELGDLLFALVNLGRWYELDAAQALTETNLRFARRFLCMEELAREQAEHTESEPPNNGSTPHLKGRTLQELEALWQQAKQQHP